MVVNDPEALTLSNMAQGIFTLANMSHDHLHGSHAALPMVERVKGIP